MPNADGAAQQRPEADADLASLDPRCLGLVRWADRRSTVKRRLPVSIEGGSFMSTKLFRVILPVASIEMAAVFYEKVFGVTGARVSGGRHYFQCGGTILACFSPREDGDAFDLPPNPDHLYFSVDDLDATFGRCKLAGCKRVDDQIKTRPWGERSFYAEDPFGNKICFVDEDTVFTG